MSSVQQIESAVARLSPEELAAFRGWFADFDAEAWDRQFEKDAATGPVAPRAGDGDKRLLPPWLLKWWVKPGILRGCTPGFPAGWIADFPIGGPVRGTGPPGWRTVCGLGNPRYGRLRSLRYENNRLVGAVGFKNHEMPIRCRTGRRTPKWPSARKPATPSGGTVATAGGDIRVAFIRAMAVNGLVMSSGQIAGH